jgi:protein-S-isoprenylcysteine O-methyltransferase Ste14
MKPAGVISLIVLSVLAWGVFHAVGAYTLNHNPWRAVMVVGCVAAFLGFWGAMLASRRARLRRAEQSRQPSRDVDS